MNNLNNPEAEQSVLVSSIMIEDNLFELIEQPEEIFYFEKNRRIFRQMQEFYFAGQKIDFVILNTAFPKEDPIRSYITKLASEGRSTIEFNGMLKNLIELKNKRILHNKCADIIQSVREGGKSVDEYSEEIIKLSESLTDTRHDGSMDMSDFAQQEIDDIFSSSHHTKTGIPAIDDMIMGLFDGQMIVVSGSPGSGKTTLAFNFAQHINDTLMISLEMTKAELFAKMLAREAKVDSMKIESLKLTADERNQLNIAKKHLSDTCRMTVNDDPMNFYQIKNYIRQQCKRRDYKLIIIDHAHLIAGGGGKSQNERFEIISRDIKLLAKELQTPIIILVQLLKEATRGISAPTLADLRGSGAWGQDADTVIFTYFMGAEDQQSHNVAIGKGRKVKIGKVHDLIFEPEYSNFKSIAPDYDNCVNPGYFHD